MVTRLLSLLVLLGLPSGAQTPPPSVPEKPKPSFPRLFPNPTGRNGYEDFVLAGDALRESTLYDRIEGDWGNATLQQIVSVMNDPAVKRAISLLQNGVRKPIVTPHLISEMTADTLFPQFAQFRQLARLLSLKLYGEAAAGKLGSAVETLELTLQLGYSTEQDTIISGLVGIAVEAIGLTRMAQIVPQFSRRDCIQLQTLLEARLKAPPTAQLIFRNERDFTLKSLLKQEYKSSDFVSPPGEGDEPLTPEQIRLKEALSNPASAKALMEKAAERVREDYDALIETAGLPAWKRKPFAPPKNDGSVAGFLTEMLTPANFMVLDRYDQNRAQLQLLALQAALRKFRWDWDRLPETLTELHLPELTTDPFTGEPLFYRVLSGGETYDLHSAGPPVRNENGGPSGGRSPIYLPALPQVSS